MAEILSIDDINYTLLVEQSVNAQWSAGGGCPLPGQRMTLVPTTVS